MASVFQHLQSLSSSFQPARANAVADTYNLFPLLRVCYLHGTVFDEVVLITIGVDVQGDRFPYVVRGWSGDEWRESWLIEFGELSGSPQQLGVWQKLGQLRERYRAQRHCWVVVDSGYLPQRVVAMCNRFGFVPVRGEHEVYRGVMSRIHNQSRRLNVSAYKDTLTQLQQQRRWHISHLTPDRYCRQILAEEKRGGKWVRLSKENHWLDCEVYALAAGKCSEEI